MIPILYVLLRNDLASMTAGRAAAQASHATSVMMKDADNGLSNQQQELYYLWKDQTDYQYGTVIVLGASPEQITQVVVEANKRGLQASGVIDPSYSVRDGKFTHYVEIMTGGYVLAEKGESLVAGLELW